MGRYFGLIPSLYDSVDYRAVALLEIVIYNRELVFYAETLPIVRNGLKKWLDVPIVLYEYAQTFFGRRRSKMLAESCPHTLQLSTVTALKSLKFVCSLQVWHSRGPTSLDALKGLSGKMIKYALQKCVLLPY
jgi:hypothetical protein